MYFCQICSKLVFIKKYTYVDKKLCKNCYESCIKLAPIVSEALDKALLGKR